MGISKKWGTCLRNFVPISGHRKFRHGKSIALSTKLVVVVVDGRACWWFLHDNRRVVAVYYKSIICNPQTQLLRLVVVLFLQSTRFWLTQRVAWQLCVAAARAERSRAVFSPCSRVQWCRQCRTKAWVVRRRPTWAASSIDSATAWSPSEDRTRCSSDAAGSSDEPRTAKENNNQLDVKIFCPFSFHHFCININVIVTKIWKSSSLCFSFIYHKCAKNLA